MIPLGLKDSEMTSLKKILRTSHRISIGVQVMDLSHNHVNDLSDKLIGGQVTIDGTAEVTRSLDLQLLDPLHQLKLDDDSMEDGSLYMTRMIRIIYNVQNIERTESYNIPIFCGPITRCDRQGFLVVVECQGKERLAMQSVWNGKTYKKGLKKTSVIRQILSSAGEASNRMDVPDLKEKKYQLRGNVSSNRKINFWNLAKKVASSLNRQLFYDGRGQCRLRIIPSKTAFTFDETTMLSLPTVNYDAQDLKNAVEILGGKKKKAKKKIHYRLVAPKNHPFSPWKLGRNSTPRYLPETIEDDAIKSLKRARQVAKKTLKRLLVESIEVSFDSFAIPFLEEGDLCRFNSSIVSGTFRLQKMTIPLTAGGKSSIGYLRRSSLSHLATRAKKAKKGK